MARPKLRKYDATGSLFNSEVYLSSGGSKYFAFVNGVWVASYEHLVLTPPPIKRTHIDWEE